MVRIKQSLAMNEATDPLPKLLITVPLIGGLSYLFSVTT